MRAIKRLLGPLILISTFASFPAYASLVERSDLIRLELESGIKETQKLPYAPGFWLGSVVPGVGQMLLDEPGRGILFMGGFVLSIPVGFGAGSLLGGVVSPATYNPNRRTTDYQPLIFGVAGALLVPVIVYGWNLVDAYWLNQEKNLAAKSTLRIDEEGKLSWQLSSF